MNTNAVALGQELSNGREPEDTKDGEFGCAIALACDEGYGMPLATTLRSIVEANARWCPLEIYIFTHRISSEFKKRVCDSLPIGAASIVWPEIDVGPFKDFLTTDHVSKITFARLLIPETLPRSLKRVLYLDCDLLVLDDLSALSQTRLHGAIVGAVEDQLNPVFKKSADASWQTVPQVENYFNAGVLLIDLDRWRENKVSERALEYLRQNPQTPFADQDALNYACDRMWKRLDEKWNFQAHFDRSIQEMETAERPRIVHFVTSNKPWIASVRSPNGKLYDAFRERTSYRRSESQKVLDNCIRFAAGVRMVLRRKLFSTMALKFYRS
jgi:lipopolysaccharide biosynthesis glycosyltransferase